MIWGHTCIARGALLVLCSGVTLGCVQCSRWDQGTMQCHQLNLDIRYASQMPSQLRYLQSWVACLCSCFPRQPQGWILYPTDEHKILNSVLKFRHSTQDSNYPSCFLLFWAYILCSSHVFHYLKVNQGHTKFLLLYLAFLISLWNILPMLIPHIKKLFYCITVG